MVSTAGPSRTTRPRRSRGATSNGRIVSSAETSAGARVGIAISGLGIARVFSGSDRKCEPQFTAIPRGRLAPAETPGENAFLGVQAVLGLVEHDRLRAVDHLVRHLVATMRGQIGRAHV